MIATLKRFARSAPGLAAAAFLMACTGGAQAAEIVMHRDPNCGCCIKWAEHAEEHFAEAHDAQDSSVEVRNEPDMRAVKERHGVPADLASCHTAIVEGYVIEGHVPAADIARLLRERPEGVKGLAVSGMPIGSPGMEMGDRQDAYRVIAFGDDGRSVWASYPASGG
jgi:hypothetical protein